MLSVGRSAARVVGLGLSRFTLRTQLFWALALSAALPVLVFGLVQADAWSESETARADRETLLASTALGRELGFAIDAHAGVVSAMAAEFGERGDFAEPELSRTLRRYRAKFTGFYVTLAIRANGVAIAADPPTGSDGRPVAGTPYGDRPYFRKLLAGAELSVSDVLTSRMTGQPAVIMVAPVRGSSDEFLGVASAGVDLTLVEQAIERVTRQVPEMSGVVLDGSGKVVAAGGTQRLASLRQLGHLRLYRASSDGMPARRSGDDGNGLIRRGTIARVDSHVVDWSVFTALPDASVRHRAQRAFLSMAVFALFATLLGLAVAAVISRYVARPVAAAALLVEAIGRGDLRVKPGPADAWHARELADLGASVQHTLKHLLGLITQLSQTAVAVYEVTRELRGTSKQMVSDSRAQEHAVRRGTGAVVQMTNSIADVSLSVGELTSSAGETSRAILSFDRQIEQIAGNLDTLTRAIERASLSINQVGEQVDAVSVSTDLLSGRVEHTEESLRILTDSIQTVTESAERSQAIAKDTILAAETGTGAVDETINATREMGASFRAVRAAVQRLADRSEAIGQVTEVIAEVTRATHVLAINASIIASQSGEHGRRFAVVAERVKLVASETAASTMQITKLVASVQTDIQQAVEAVARGQNTVQTGEERSVEAGRRLRLIMQSSAQAEQQVRKIAEATHRQSARVHAVQTAFYDVRQATDRIGVAASAQREARQDLDQAMLQLGVVGQDVQRSTETQRGDSRAMTEAVRTMTERLQAIARAIQAQHDDRQQITQSLSIFNQASLSSVERSVQIEHAVNELSQRLAQLELQLRSFRVD